MDLRKVLWMAIALGAAAARGEDLTTLQHVTYTNVKVRRHDLQGILVQHEGGETKIPYADILPELREYYKRMASDLTPAKEAAAPEPPPGPDDFITVDGQIFRNVEVLRTEPDGLTFRHAGGVTKRRFVSLPEAVRNRFGFDPEAEKKYLRDQSEAQKRAQDDEATRRALKKFDPQSAPTGVAEPIAVVEVKTRKLPNKEYQVSFTVQNRTDQLLFIRTIPYDAKMKALAGGKKFKIQPRAEGEQLELVVPLVPPSELRVYCGDFQTNRALRW